MTDYFIKYTADILTPEGEARVAQVLGKKEVLDNIKKHFYQMKDKQMATGAGAR